jgi:hypothetical protein
MPERETIERAREDTREDKSPSTQAGEFVREEMHHIREGKHGAASTKQAIATGLSKARRSGVKLSPPHGGKTSASTSQKAESDYRKGQSHSRRRPSARRSRATSNVLKKKGRSAASPASLSNKLEPPLAIEDQLRARMLRGKQAACASTQEHRKSQPCISKVLTSLNEWPLRGRGLSRAIEVLHK